MDYEKEVYRLKVKCNDYAKRLVLEGFDDVSWEITSGNKYSLLSTPANIQQQVQADSAGKPHSLT